MTRDIKKNARRRTLSITVAVLLTGVASGAQQSKAQTATQLLDHLAGRWVMTGTLGGKQTTHDLEAEWVLRREYIRFHEVSRDKQADGTPAYEAIVFLSWHAKTSQFTCMWLDNTQGGGLSPQGIALGKPTPDAIPLVFTVSGGTLDTTFRYNGRADTWRLTIDDMSGGKTDRFGDMTLTRARVSP